MLTSPQIATRPYRLDDVAAVFEAVILSRHELRPWMPWCHDGYAIEETQAWIAARIELSGTGTEHSFAIVSADGRFLGSCGLNAVDAASRRANLGYWVRSDATRRGIATSVIQQLARWTFSNTQLLRLEIVVAVGNVASQRAAENAGAVREGVLRNRLVLHGEAHDAVMYSIVPTDPLASRADWR